ncbi:ribosomal-protein-alanine N-acetyltransferase [Salirhabdus euzebyi]|uniref:Ribosomal-protein-alanine N-acetyltransferase n=1 Tax=Salirhabdus euzebyi TaxID=394506 RepID=A0A841Q9C4_9BACI|nr:GNAT family N-acetyltransferase [Salirhabdus euzebyi]MBB6454996.1 ribosomal-protein-alanine N-acetyltransferase [Salirhabdus euzebyi]
MIICSDRLFFHPITRTEANLLMISPNDFESISGLSLNKDWPHDGLRAYLPIYVEQLLKNNHVKGYGPWIVYTNEKKVIGDIGFRGVPGANGYLEVGYYITPAERKKGYASESLGVLCDWAFSQTGVKGILAECEMKNRGSQMVLEKNRFVRIANDGYSISYELLKI